MFKEAMKTFECDVTFFTKVIIYQHFQQAFCKFQFHFYQTTFVLKFVMKYFTSSWFEGY